jgi:hypothetical protein
MVSAVSSLSQCCAARTSTLNPTPCALPTGMHCMFLLTNASQRCRQQYVVMPEEDLVAVPDEMDDQTAAQFYVSGWHKLLTSICSRLHMRCKRPPGL